MDEPFVKGLNFFKLKIMIYLFITQRGREEEKEGEKHRWYIP